MVSSMTGNTIIHHENSPSSSTSILTSTINNNNHVSTPNIKTTSSGSGGATTPSTYHLNLSSDLSNGLKRKNLYNSNNISATNQLLNLLPQNNLTDNNSDGLLLRRNDTISPRSSKLSFNEMDDDSCEYLERAQPPLEHHTKLVDENKKDNTSPVPNPIDFSGNNANIENFFEAQKAFQKLTSQISGFNQRNPFHLNTISPFLVAALQQHQNQFLFNNINNANEIENINGNNDSQAVSDSDINLNSIANDYLGNVSGVLNAMFNGTNAAIRLNNKDGNDEKRATGTGSTTSSLRSRASPIEHMFSGEDDDEEYCKQLGEPEDLSIGYYRKERKNEIDESGVPSNWTYEEQFKQLYDLSDDIKRKEWLDEWLNFMNRIGKPVTRIPIMAKQVLDLYELYRLVVQHGGLVEIINKKLWREITKGLNLPNSITSAAFTLRTQYQKYLYDFECEHENLSNISDLQAAIEGNRREGRRTNPSDLSAGSPTQNLACNIGRSASRSHLPNSRLSANDGGDGIGNGASAMFAAAAAASGFTYPFLGHNPHSMASFFGKNNFNIKDDMLDFGSAMANQQNALVQRQFEFFQKAAMDAMVASNAQSGLGSSNNFGARSDKNSSNQSFTGSDAGAVNCGKAKRAKLDCSAMETSSNFSPNVSVGPISTYKPSTKTNLKIQNSKSEKGENSMIVSMEVNGVLYNGVLFASNNPKLDTNEMANNALSNTIPQESAKINLHTNSSNHSNLLKNSVNNNNNVNDNNHKTTELNVSEKNEKYSFDGDYVNDLRLNNIIGSNCGESKPIINDTTFSALIVPTTTLSDILKENN